MAEPLFTFGQLTDRLSAISMTRLFDDDDDGIPDTGPFEQIRRDASAKVRGKLGPVYNPDNITAEAADEVQRVALDQAVAMACQRFPEVMRNHNWVELMKQADQDLKDLRTGLANLGVNTSPEPAANQGGTVTSGDPNDPCYPEPKEHFALDGTGSF